MGRCFISLAFHSSEKAQGYYINAMVNVSKEKNETTISEKPLQLTEGNVYKNISVICLLIHHFILQTAVSSPDNFTKMGGMTFSRGDSLGNTN